MFPLRSTFALLMSVSAVAACSRRDSDANAQNTEDTAGTAKRLVVVSAPTSAYRIVTRTDTGSIQGNVLFQGIPQGDTLQEIDAEQSGCNKALTIKRLERKDGKIANAVVWLTNIREGKSLPLDRRFELRNADCAWDPVVQVALTGGALNVFNADPLVEEANIIEISSGDTAGIAPFTDPGQVIPYGTLLKTPKAFEFSIESRPMSRAWVIVLDHPYSSITKDNGSFSITGIPAGQYILRTWHPMLGVIDTPVTVQSGQTTTVDPQFR